MEWSPKVGNLFLKAMFWGYRIRHPVFLAEAPRNIPDNIMELVEKFITLIYDRGTESYKVNELRKHLFSRKSRALENIPPTHASLVEHVKRATYQGGHIWGQALQNQPDLPSPSEWGWERTPTSSWTPKWTTLEQVQAMCQELISCNCKKSCTGLCKCYKANLACTSLCFCEGSCFKK